jgi:hypothetical protein
LGLGLGPGNWGSGPEHHGNWRRHRRLARLPPGPSAPPRPCIHLRICGPASICASAARHPSAHLRPCIPSAHLRPGP